jgi:hypothetical protein
MAATEASIGYGSLFDISRDDGDTWLSLGEVFDITPPSAAIDVIDATHMASPNRTREFIAGLTDPGDASFSQNFVPGSAADTTIREIRATGERVICRITYPNASVWKFDGFLTGYNPAVPADDKMTAEVTFKVTGSTVVEAAAIPAVIVGPAISGTVQQGETLTAYPGQWSGGPAFTYQWNNEGAPISGATGQTYVPVVGDVGDNLTVTITATNSEGSAQATSPETVAVLAE